VHAILTLLHIALMVYCVVDLVATHRSKVRSMPKPVWFIIVIFIPLFGSLLWILLGRPEDAGFAPGTTNDEAASPPPRSGPYGRSAADGSTAPRGPEDDPNFLRDIDERLRRDRRDGRGGDT